MVLFKIYPIRARFFVFLNPANWAKRIVNCDLPPKICRDFLMKSLALAHTSWLQPFFEYFQERQVDLGPYMEKAGISPEMFNEGEGWIAKSQLYRFLNCIAEGEELPQMGFVVGERITPDYLGAIWHAMADAGTLAEALEQFCLLVPRHVEDNELWIEEGDVAGELWLCNTITNREDGVRDLADHAGLMSLVNVIRLVAGRNWYPARVTLQSGPTNAMKQVDGLVNCEVRFRSKATAVAFPAEFMLRSINNKPDGSNVGGKVDDVGLLAEDETTWDRLRRLLEKVVGVGGVVPSASLTSELIGISSRSLYRKLASEEKTYQELIDTLRVQKARELLSDPETTVKEVATVLGFSGANNFIPFFKRKLGMTPAEFRRSCPTDKQKSLAGA